MKYGREWTAGVVAGLIAGVVGGWIATTIGGWLIATEAAHWWEIASAAATFLAVVVALGSSWYAHRAVRITKEREGRIVAAQLSMSLPPLVRRLKDALGHFQRAKDGNHDGAWAQAGCVEDGFDVLRGIGDLIPQADLAALAWADGRAADEIAKALGSIHQILAHRPDPVGADEQVNGVEPHRYFFAASHCANAARLLDSARRRCSKLSVVKYRVDEEWRLPNTETSGYSPAPWPEGRND